MLNSGKRVSVFSALCMLIALCVLASCNFGNKPKLPKPPFETSIDLSRKGVVADFDIRVTWRRVYYFELRFGYPEGDWTEKERVRKIVGDYGRDKDNNLIEPGILTPVKLMIFKKQAQNEQIVYQKTTKDPETVGFSSSAFFKNLSYCDLPRGEYRFVLESFAQLQEYESIPTSFHVTFPAFPK